MAAAALFVETSGIVQYHLAGSDERYSRDRPTKILMNAVRSWAQERGDVRLHLGGGVGGADDSLMHFKAGFSDERHVFQTLRVVVDEGTSTGDSCWPAIPPRIRPTSRGSSRLIARPDAA